jgi:4-diphosphocytidyl-2-C-methyl-D-erythritol kinase
VSTPVVYKTWDDLGGPTSDGVNDLEPAACAAYPDLGRWRSRIKALGIEPILAGSGATWFVHGHIKDIAKALPDARVYFTDTLA